MQEKIEFLKCIEIKKKKGIFKVDKEIKKEIKEKKEQQKLKKNKA